MDMNEYTAMPIADLSGTAGGMCPGERERRYSPYTEKRLLLSPQGKDSEESYGTAKE